MIDQGASLDAELAVAALDSVRVQAQITLEQAVAEAPVDAPEHDLVHHGRVPGQLRASARIVYLVNEEHFEECEPARARARELAAARGLYRVDAEIRFDTEYARRQHDQLDLEHPHGGKAKYLEHPIQQAAPQLNYRLRQAIT
jgi:hypothetical protein